MPLQRGFITNSQDEIQQIQKDVLRCDEEQNQRVWLILNYLDTNHAMGNWTCVLIIRHMIQLF